MIRILGLLVRLYPPGFRAEYERRIRDGLASALEIGGRGRLGRVGAFAAAVFDLVRGAGVQWWSVVVSNAHQGEGRGRMNRFEVTQSILRLAGRRIRKSPGFSALVVLTLALGIGANAAVFSLVNGVLLRPLPYDQPDDLVFIWSDLTNEGVPRAWINGSHAADLRDNASLFSAMVPMDLEDASLSHGGGEDARPVTIGAVASNFFPTLGVTPALGRGFLPAEEGPNAPAVVVLTDELWRTAFGENAAVLGSDVMLDGVPFQVVGVMPPGFAFRVHQSLGDPTPPDLYVPLFADLATMDMNFGFSLALLGRIAPGVPHARAFSELDQIGSRLGERDWGAPDFRFRPVYVAQDLVAKARPLILLLMTAVGAVLLIVCANVATVFLARGVARQRDSAVQVALGASYSRLVAGTAAESLLLALCGAALGLPLAHAAVKILVRMMPADLPRVDEVTVDLQVGLLTLLAAALAGLATSVAPGLLHRTSSRPAILQGSQSRSGNSGGVGRMQRGLVGFQIALSTALLIAVALIGKSMVRLFEVDAGFRPEDQLVFSIQAGTEDTEDAPLLDYYETLQRRIAQVPGVRSVGRVSGLPLSTRANQHHLELSGAPGATGDSDLDEPLVDRMVADPGYARAAGIELTEGRWFEAQDMELGTKVALLDQILAERFWPNGSPVGSRVGPPWDSVGFQVIGVVRQQRLYDLGADDRPQWWVPHSWRTARQMSLVVDSDQGGRVLPNDVRRIVRDLDPTVAISGMRTMNDIVIEAVSRWRFALLIMGLFGLAALLLALLGVYGVVAYSVERRTGELGIRMALGAESRSIVRMVVAQGVRLVLAGLVLGILGAWASGRFLSSLLYGVTPRDPVVTVAVVVVLLGCAALATWLPARRASRITPMEAFRFE